MKMLDTPSDQGCQIFLGATYQNGKNIPKDHKMYQMDIQYTIWQKSRQNDHKNTIVFHITFTQIVIFGLKKYHLATLPVIKIVPKHKHSGRKVV
jgi:hypothetical protein